MTELEKTVEALKLCVEQDALKKAMAKLDNKATTPEPVHYDVNSVKYFIGDLLMKIGMPTHIKGHRFTISAIRLLIEQPEMADGITKWLYPEVAKLHNSTPSRVERAIRHGIEVAWTRGDLEVLRQYFGNTIDAFKGKPTNSEFLTRMAEIVWRGSHE